MTVTKAGRLIRRSTLKVVVVAGARALRAGGS